MKRLLPLVFVCLALGSYSQELIERQWSLGLNTFLSGITQSSDNSYHAVYSIYDNQADTSLAVFAKFDENLNMQWAKRYKTFINDDMGSVIELNDGNFLLGGRVTQSFTLVEGGCLTKVDPEGNLIWHKVYDGSGDDRMAFISEQDDGTIVAFNRRGVSNEPIRVMHLDGDGLVLSQNEYFANGAGLDAGTVRYDGSAFYVFGDVFDSVLGRNVVYVMYMTPEEVLWAKSYDIGVSFTSPWGALSEEGDILVGALQSDPESVLNGLDIALMRLDSDGNPIWAKKIFREGNGLSEFRGGLIPLSNGDFLFSQRHQTEGPFIPVFSRFDSDGNPVWTKAKEGVSLSYFFAIDEDVMMMGGATDGASVLGMSTAAGDFACATLEAEFDIEDQEVIESELEIEVTPANLGLEEPEITVTDVTLEASNLCQATVSVEEVRKEEVKLYPNPTYGRVNVELPHSINLLEIRDVTGRVVVRHQGSWEKTFLDLGIYPSGIYTVHSNHGFLGRVVKL